jgi:hypothetical protein
MRSSVTRASPLHHPCVILKKRSWNTLCTVYLFIREEWLEWRSRPTMFCSMRRILSVFHRATSVMCFLTLYM